MAKFVHLHSHTEYSLLDGLSKISKMVKGAKELGMEAMAITDHGGMYGAIEFYKACVKNNVKPILGCELYVAPRSHTSKEGKIDTEPYHLTVVAKNYQGYLNLMKLVSISYLDGFYYKPRVDKALLRQYHEGLICLSGCPAGEFIRAMNRDDLKKAEEVARTYRDIFGEGNYFFELQNHEYDKLLLRPNQDPIVIKDLTEMGGIQKMTWNLIKELSPKLGIPMVATNDFHYVKEDDAAGQDALVCVQTGKVLSDMNRLRMIDTPNLYMKSPDEMLELFKELPEALETSVKIAESCNVEITLGKPHFPIFQIPEGYTSIDYLKKLTLDGAKDKGVDIEKDQESKDRLDYELGVIEKKQYSDYFLVVHDFVRWAQDRGVITNTRGSAAGSLVLYCLGVTNSNPLTYMLPFERFLTVFRPSLPDIDVDLADDRRDEVIRYVMDKYGEDHVSHIVTFGTMMGRAAIRDIGRVMGMAYGEVDRIAKLIPPPHQGFHTPLSEAIKQIPELSEMYRISPQVKRLFDLAMKVEGAVRHASVHAAGIVIAPDELTKYTPLQREANGDKIVAQYDMFSVGEDGVGLVKMDFLGIRNLSILGRSLEFVKANRGIEIDLYKIAYDDKKTFELLARGETMGLFQLEGSGMTRYLVELQPTNIFDIMAMIALYRPGPLSIIPEYIARKHDPSKIGFFDPRMKEYLDRSLGLLVYQDDVLLTAINIAGYSWEEADKFRKAMGKKIPEEMMKQKDHFVEGAVKNGMTHERAEELFKLIEPFAAYGFNKCLSGETVIYDAASGEAMSIESLYKSAKSPHVLSLRKDYTLGTEPVVSVQQNGVKEVFEVTTRRGLKIKATDNHPFLTVTGWNELRTLKVGDRIGTARLAEAAQNSYPIENYKLETLGYLLAEGNLCHPNGVYYYSKSDEEVNDFINSARQFRNSRLTINSSKSAKSVYVGKQDQKEKNGLFEWLKELKLLGKKATEKNIPDFVYRLSENQLAIFLAKMWQGDGCISISLGGQIYYATSSGQMIRQLQHLLLRLGIIGTIHKKHFKYRGNTVPGFTLNISRYSNIKAFAETIGKHLIGDSHQSLDQLLANHRILSCQLDPLSARGSKDIIPAAILPIIRQEVSAAYPSMQAFSNNFGISERLFLFDRRKIGFLRETVTKIGSDLNSPRLLELGNSDVYWDEIVEIKSAGFEMTYDLTIPETHNFVANDFIVHNSHAASYGMISYQTAYMKANYPVEFMAAVMTAEYGDSDKISHAVAECKKMGIEVLPPDINLSRVGFTIETLPKPMKGAGGMVFTQGIRFGLSAIKNVGIGAIESIIKAREKGEFKNLADLCLRVDTRLTNRKTLESLIKAGALDKLGGRAPQLVSLDECLDLAHKNAKNTDANQVSLFGEEEVKVSIPEFDLPNVPEMPLEEILKFEKDLLGFYLHEPPYMKRLNQIDGFVSIKVEELAEEYVGRKVSMGGVITEVKQVMTKKSQSEMAFVRIFDGTGELECVVFPKLYAQIKDALAQEEVVIIEGKIDNRDDSFSLIVDALEIFDEENSKRIIKASDFSQVEVEIPKQIDREILRQINAVLKQFPGNSPISLLFSDGERSKRMSLQFGVNPKTELLNQVEQILGKGSVRII